MKANVLIFATSCLLLGWMTPGDAMTIRFNYALRDTNKDIPLSMVEDAVDDMYLGCSDTMMKLVKDNYIEEEKYRSPFPVAWEKAERCADNRFKDREDKALTKDHMRAICVYTGDDVYADFNTAVRTQGSVYGSSFQFHSLHYLLTSAIQILSNNHNCRPMYRRSSVRFTGKVNQTIRFGSFTSSSFRTDLKSFGNETCFKIKTCSGAFLKKYSNYNEEEEVLIPPYEMFNITEISNDQGKVQGLEDCKVVFVLESVGEKSNLNCKVAHS